MGGFALANLAQLISFKVRPQLSPCDIGKYECATFFATKSPQFGHFFTILKVAYWMFLIQVKVYKEGLSLS